MPRDLFARSRVRIWIDFCNTRLQSAGGDIAHGHDVEKASERLAQHLKTLDRELEGREFIAGDYSLADVTYIPFFVRKERYKAKIDGSLPNLKAWMERLLNRPVVRATP